MNKNVKFSVLMPTYNQCAFIRRAILSLMKQTYKEWELIIINDGCTDETEDYIADYLEDPRITYIKNEENTGLGHALNQGLDAAKYDYIAYLPSDDYYFENHLETIKEKFEENVDTVLVYSGMKFAKNDTQQVSKTTDTQGLRPGTCLQLVQTSHVKIPHQWIERKQYLTEDLFQMYWINFLEIGNINRTCKITCYWTLHPFQRHKIVGERYGGGLNKLRSYYKIKDPIKIKISRFKFTDEEKLYSDFREKCTLESTNPLKILLVGELAYNSERIYALERAGHKLYGLWMPNPEYSFLTVGPLPFGHVIDIPFDSHWEESVRRIKPDVIYGLLNSGAVPFVYDVVKGLNDIPFVWHFKEGPSVCLARGTWDKLMYLYKHASGRIYLNKPSMEWYNLFLPKSDVPTMIMDGDLPSGKYFGKDFSNKLSDIDGEIHTVVTGRLIGLSKGSLEILAQHKIHVHLYTESYFDLNARITDSLLGTFPNTFHYHHHIEAPSWTTELSKYDAGWLHCYASRNRGNLMNASWDDLNMPARMGTYAAAGLPFIIPQNDGHIVASRDVATDLNVAITYDNYHELAEKLISECETRSYTRNMIAHRLKFSFDYYLPQLIALFRQSIEYKRTIWKKY